MAQVIRVTRRANGGKDLKTTTMFVARNRTLRGRPDPKVVRKFRPKPAGEWSSASPGTQVRGAQTY